MYCRRQYWAVPRSAGEVMTMSRRQEAGSKTEGIRTPRLVKPAEAAAFLRTTTANLKIQRCRPTWGIPYVKIGTAVRYDLNDLEEFIRRRTVRPDTDGSKDER
jgi:hypothetical protein